MSSIADLQSILDRHDLTERERYALEHAIGNLSAPKGPPIEPTTVDDPDNVTVLTSKGDRLGFVSSERGEALHGSICSILAAYSLRGEIEKVSKNLKDKGSKK